MNILLVDDDEDVVTLLKFRLDKANHQVVVAQTGNEALKKAQSLKPDLILMDINIPEPNGIEVCQTLKKEAKTAQIPIILLTGATQVKESDAPADALVIKPYEWESLQATIQKVCKAAK